MRRGDVVRTWAEYIALPPGTQVIGINGLESTRGESPPEAYSDNEEWLPALVRVVGRIEPEWLEAAAEAMYCAIGGERGWSTISSGYKADWRKRALAAVAAADKARGIVNSREEFDALDAGTQVVDCRGADVWVSGGQYTPDTYPCVVIR